MKPELLFLDRYQRLTEQCRSGGEVTILDLSATLRQLIVDGHSLADAVNLRRIPLIFVAGVSGLSPNLPPPTFYSLGDFIDPSVFPGRTSVSLSKSGFLAHTVAFAGGRPFTVKDIIKYGANAAGGVHYDSSPRPEFQSMHNASQSLSIGGLPFGISMLRAIGRVTLQGLSALEADVRSRGY